MKQVFDNPVHISLAILQKMSAETRFAYCTEYGPVEVLSTFYTAAGELVFVTEYGHHYAARDEVIQVSKEDWDKFK